MKHENNPLNMIFMIKEYTVLYNGTYDPYEGRVGNVYISII